VRDRAFYPALDGLRAVAFLMVFFQHYTAMPWGWTGVNVFFVLSGFLITGILFDNRDDPHRARNFYIHRTLRIFPLYYGLFLGFLLLNPIMRWNWSPAWLAWPLYLGNFLRFRSPAVADRGSSQQLAADGHLTSLRFPKFDPLRLGHFWSLCVEEQFYLAWPWVVFSVRSRRTLLWICGGVVVVVPVLRVVAQHTAPPWMVRQALLDWATPSQVDALLLGGFVALLWRGPNRKRLLFNGKVVAAIAAVVAASYLAMTIRPGAPGDYVYPSWMFTWGMTFANIFAACVLLCALHSGNLVHRVLALRPLRWLGRISYGAYVLHEMFHDLYRHIVSGTGVRYVWLTAHFRLGTAALALASTVFLAWLSFRFVETPFLNLKERWTIRDNPLH